MVESYNHQPSPSFIDQTLGYKVQLFVQCRKLKDVDAVGELVSDPVCFLYYKQDAK